MQEVLERTGGKVLGRRVLAAESERLQDLVWVIHAKRGILAPGDAGRKAES